MAHGRMTNHQRFPLGEYRTQIEFLNERIAWFEQRIDEQVSLVSMTCGYNRRVWRLP